MSFAIGECEAFEALFDHSWQRSSCFDWQSEVSTDCSEGESSSSNEAECVPPSLWKIPSPFPASFFRRGRTRSKELVADQDVVLFQLDEDASSSCPKSPICICKSPMPRARKETLTGALTPASKFQLHGDAPEEELTLTPSTPLRLPAAALWASEIDGGSSNTETPKAKKEIISTPPSGPVMLQRRLRDDIEAALSRKSLPLLSLALLRSHCCGADHNIHEAVRRQHVKALKFLLQHATGSQVDDHCNAKRPLHSAIQNCMSKDGAGFQMAEVLVSYGANPNACCGDDPSLGSPLHMAAKRGSLPMVTLLLAHGADPNARDLNGQTPLHASCRQIAFEPDFAQEKVARLLLSHGACPVQVDSIGLSPSDHATTAGMRMLMLKAAKYWAQQQLAPVRGAVNGNADQQVPWLLPEILNALVDFL